MSSSETPSDARFCADAARAQDGDRYLIALFQPKRLRRAAIALTAWNIELARARPRSGETTIGLMRLQWHRDALGEIAEGRARRHPVIQELAAAYGEGVIRIDDLQAIVDARERDLDPAPPKTLAELEAYVRGTAGALHASLWRGGASERAAEDAGTAFGLVGLARAEPVNQARGRPWAPKALAHDLCPIVERAEALAAAAFSAPAKSARAPAALATVYAKRAARAGYVATDPLMAKPDPWRLWRMSKARLFGRV